MEPIFETIVAFFQKDGWQVEPDFNDWSLMTNFQGAHGQWRCYGVLQESPKQFVFYSICPIIVASENRLAMADFLTRANYNLLVGNFEMDFEDGEIRYKTSINFEGSQLDHALLKQLAYINVVMMNQYLPGIIAVLNDNVPPADAISQIERQTVNL
ncbi:YbjN domain-containing protein [Coleofasciculus sp. FACHB-SPT36]|uniref:YbjN domain-containing protein n=1 Tax=Cyanophyceae TaxID=3028117 RepID=UPI00168ADE9E|nr:YbjN domain-containing protein [Coleofasciculus sp. FACHB-SPT36]MBD2541006.1 YbjN domain-containing protein [Coleofasciculus sp. FACHB-SPT36]